MDVIFKDVTFGYNAPLLSRVSFHMSKGWSAVVGRNGSGKSTVIRLALGELHPDGGTVISPGGVCCEQRCDEAPAGFTEFCGASDGEARRLAGCLSIAPDWPLRWETLSFGERKRAQIATALWRQPALLALDEPTNHLDSAARRLLSEALASYRGIGILVSHDRELLESLPYQCLHLDSIRAVMRPGSYFEGKEQADREDAFARGRREKIAANIARLQKEASFRRGLACGADRMRSKRKVGRKDHDAKEKIDRARISGKDAVQGKILGRIQGRIRQEQELLDSVAVRAEPCGAIFLGGDGRGSGYAFVLEPGDIPIGGRTIRHPLLAVKRGEKIALTGANGSGKTTLLRAIASRVPGAFLIAQEISAAESQKLLCAFLSLENGTKGRILTAVENLGTDAKRLLATTEPSPGELRKLLVAMALEKAPSILLLDEPTNHMDLYSVERLEKCLADSRVTMVIVSHDARFVAGLADALWDLKCADAVTSVTVGAP